MGSSRKLWNRNFTILWQGQLISDFGNTAFSVALGFWVLEMTRTPALPTGNMALMGIVEACFALPAVLLGPFAGAFADRHERKRVIVAADFVRGVLFALMGASAIFHVFPLWALYPLAALSGACGAFFGPAMSSAIPDIVQPEDLSQANSARGFSSAATQLLGNSLGGLLYARLTAPVLILVNGISFLYAAFTQLFIKIPPRKAAGPRRHILSDMLEGVKYTFGHRGLRSLILINMVIGFFSTIIITLMTPLFKTTAGFGAERYGYVMGTMMVGAVLGMLIFSAVKIPPRWRAWFFCASQLTVGVVIVPLGMVSNVVWLFPMTFIVGFCNSIIGTLLQTVLQSTIPPENRGKVFGILGTVSGALAPLSLALAGGIASAVGLHPTIVGACCALLAFSLPFVFSRHFRRFMNTDIAAEPTAAQETSAEAASV